MDACITPLDGALDNDPVGCLIDVPLFTGDVPDDLVMTSDEWAAVRGIVAQTRRPIRFKTKTAQGEG